MRIPQSSLLAAAASLLTFQLAYAQTYTKCNPLHQSCPADPALAGSKSVDFTSGESSDFTGSGNGISYDSNGVALTVSQSGDSPTLTSNWYLMFGRVDITLKAAPGVGIVSSAVMQSDDLDEIDWEWLGKDPSQVQSNYFGKGYAGTYNRGAFHSDPTSQSDFNTYTIDWTPDQIVWQINGVTVRTLTPASAGDQYPQTPMQIKVGSWSGGDPSNEEGTIEWAGGSTNYAAGPYTMYVQSIAATDYSTGTQYEYSGTSGSWQEVRAVGGSIMGAGSTPVDSAAPSMTATFNGVPVPFSGTHQESSTAEIPTSIPGLPPGWTITSSGKVQPPSSAPTPAPGASSTSSVAALPSAPLVLAGGSRMTAKPYPTFYQGQGQATPSGPVKPTYSPPVPLVTGNAAAKPVLSGSIFAAACALAGYAIA